MALLLVSEFPIPKPVVALVDPISWTRARGTQLKDPSLSIRARGPWPSSPPFSISSKLFRVLFPVSVDFSALIASFNLAKGQVLQTQHFNNLLAQSAGTEFDELINLSTLRSMTQAYYNPENFGHFGLALKSYAHFTSPIRRYADLIVHRALIASHGWGDDGLSVEDTDHLDETAVQISDTERRSMAAERDTTDRYLASYLTDRVGNEFDGRISGVTRFGLFVKLDETGADGLIPIRTLGREFFEHDADANTLTGSDTGITLGLGLRVTVRLAEAVAVTGGLRLELLSLDGNALPRGPSLGRGKPMARKSAKSRKKAAKTKRKVARKRR